MRDKHPFYDTDIEHPLPRADVPVKEKKKKQSNEVDNINAIGSWIIKSIAILGVVGLAFYYDGQWIPVAIGSCVLLLGIELRYVWIKKQNGNGGK